MRFELNFGPKLQQIRIAVEVVQSAIRILRAVGMSTAEIQKLFADAATGPIEGDDKQQIPPTEAESEVQEDEEDAYALDRRFEASEIGRRVSRLAKRLESLREFSEESECLKGMSMLKEVLSLAREVQDWYQEACNTSARAFHLSHDVWVEKAADEELDKEEHIIFYDQTSAFRALRWWGASRLFQTAVELGLQDNLAQIAEVVARDNVYLDARLLRDLGQAIERVKLRGSFIKKLEDLPAGTEIPERELVQQLFRGGDDHPPEYLPRRWIEPLIREGKLERRKQSGRWQIRRL